LSSTKKRTIAWFVAAAIYTLIINILKVSFDVKYFLIPAGSLPFSTGALLYHYRDEILARCPALGDRRAPYLLFALWILELALAVKRNAYLGWGYYLNEPINAAIVLSLLSQKSLPAISQKLDRALGDLSYPIYLLHFPSGMLLVALGFTAAKRGQPLFFFAALPLLLALSWLVTHFVEWPIEAVRARIKSSILQTADGKRQTVATVTNTGGVAS
jgi:peptidoglycan/LPS O-acetylase OafA/YrhL